MILSFSALSAGAFAAFLLFDLDLDVLVDGGRPAEPAEQDAGELHRGPADAEHLAAPDGQVGETESLAGAGAARLTALTGSNAASTRTPGTEGTARRRVPPKPPARVPAAAPVRVHEPVLGAADIMMLRAAMVVFDFLAGVPVTVTQSPAVMALTVWVTVLVNAVVAVQRRWSARPLPLHLH